MYLVGTLDSSPSLVWGFEQILLDLLSSSAVECTILGAILFYFWPTKGNLSNLKDDEGQIVGAHSIGVGLEYPGVSPELSFLKDIRRAEFYTVTDQVAIDGGMQHISLAAGVKLMWSEAATFGSSGAPLACLLLSQLYADGYAVWFVAGWHVADGYVAEWGGVKLGWLSLLGWSVKLFVWSVTLICCASVLPGSGWPICGCVGLLCSVLFK
ncbi:Tryptophan synthase beta chain 1 [Camellia lanceoleosa]|uniref:Tryptophan synthase beta chain 1 n=1 Tax=Camellia lanceoleosa TaxID=1840588 RepID=A0ACC0IQ06_9ERIC|nr:Tryptophan synthase beta chain 1 [Camellia lanceoleosa]